MASWAFASPFHPSVKAWPVKPKRTSNGNGSGGSGDGDAALSWPLLYGSASNVLTTSSDSSLNPNPAPTPTTSTNAVPVASGVKGQVYGNVLHVTGLPRDLLRQLGDDNDEMKKPDYELDDSQRNLRGTFSKEYAAKFPHIAWQHRGQGRYLPVSEVESKVAESEDHIGAIRRTSSRQAYLERQPSSPITLKRQSSSSLARGFGSDFATPALPTKRSITYDDAPHSAYSLRQRPSEPDTPSQSEMRAIRLSRRVRPIAMANSDQASDEDDEDDESDDESDNGTESEVESDGIEKTIRREEVEAREALGDHGPWYHTGNGWYKRGIRPTPSIRKDSSSHSVSQRRESDTMQRRASGRLPQRRESNAVISVSGGGEDEDDWDRTMKIEELLNKYPGHTYHHCGNGWYKLGVAASSKRPSHVAPLYDGEEAVSSDVEYGLERTVSKEYKEAHPEIEWVHRGNGRYKRVEDIQHDVDELDFDSPPTKQTTKEQDDEKSKTTEYVRQFNDHKQYFDHVGFGRWRPKPGLTLNDIIAHASGTKAASADTRTRRMSQPTFASRVMKKNVSNSNDGDSIDSDGLVDRAYVDRHPHQNFYHRGQGRWKPGLPPIGSSRKIAVRGPDAARFMEQNREQFEEQEQRLAPREEELYDHQVGSDRVPGLLTFVKRDEMEKWPQFKWHYRGGNRWSRMSKDDPRAGPSWRERNRIGKHATDDPDDEEAGAQLEREAAVADPADSFEQDDPFEDAETGHLLSVPVTGKGKGRASPLKRKRSALHIPLSNSGTSTPKAKMLEPDEDVLAEEDFPELYRDEWSPFEKDEPDDEAAHLVRSLYRPMTGPEAFIKALVKHDPTVRPTNNLIALAENAQSALEQMQDEYLRLERITAPHARIPRKPNKGGRKPLDHEEFEDRKEADLYDYAFDAKRIGFQDPIGQKIQRDAEGRELRTRRKRGEVDIITADAALGDPGEGSSRRRTIRPVNRFDGVDTAPKRRRGPNKNGSATPDPLAAVNIAPPTIGEVLPNGYVVPTSGRWAGHIPKRIRELRGESVGSGKAEGEKGSSPGPTGARKGRPPGSKNLRKRKDAGIPKGPRKKKEVVVDTVETPMREETAGMETP